MKTLAFVLTLAVAIAAFAFFRRARSSPPPPPTGSSSAFVMSQGDWIRVRSGSPESVLRGVASYGEVLDGEDPQNFVVVLSMHRNGDLVLTFPEKLPAYPFMNLIGWLNDPPGIEGVSGTTGWYTSPATGTRYSLEPDNSNPAGDTLVGHSSAGEFVEVYQPEIGVCVASRQFSPEPEPRLEQLHEISRITIPVPLEVRESFGNPQFVITHPPNTQWY